MVAEKIKLRDLVREALAFERKRLAGALEGLMGEEDAKSIDRVLPAAVRPARNSGVYAVA